MTIYLGSFEAVALDDDGPDGIYLTVTAEDGAVRLRVFDDDVVAFDAALEPLREYRREYARQKAAYDAASPALRAEVLGLEPPDSGYDPSDPKSPGYYERMTA